MSSTGAPSSKALSICIKDTSIPSWKPLSMISLISKALLQFGREGWGKIEKKRLQYLLTYLVKACLQLTPRFTCIFLAAQNFSHSESLLAERCNWLHTKETIESSLGERLSRMKM